MSLSLKRTQRRDLSLRPSCIEDLRPKICTAAEQPKVSRKKNKRERPSIRAVFGIHLLPPEILAHVFVLGSLADIMLPIHVSHSCSSWRQLALLTPELWRRIYLDGRDVMWKERMRRAKACALDVYLVPASRGRSVKPLDDSIVQKRMHVILPHLHRIRSLAISFPPGERSPYLCNAALSPLCPNISLKSRFAMPRLSSLTLSHPDNDDTKTFALFAGSAPRLRRLTLVGIRLDWLPSLFGNLSYLNYTHHGFTHGFKAVREILNILSTTSQLVQLCIRIPPSNDRKSWPPAQTSQSRLEGSMIQLLKLESLTLVADFLDPQMEMECYAYLVWHLALPSVRLLCLEATKNPIPRAAPANLRTLFTNYTARLHQFWGIDTFRGLRSLRVIRCSSGWYGDGRPVVSFAETGLLRKLRRVEAQKRDENGNTKDLIHRFR